MIPLVLSEPGLSLSKCQDGVVIERDGRPIHTVPIHEVEEVHLYGGADLTVGARNLLLDRGIDVVFLTADGRYRGRLVGPVSAWSARRLAQYRMVGDPGRVLHVARAVVVAKIRAQRGLLQYRQKRLRSPAVASAATRLRSLVDRAGECTDVESLLGVEGAAAVAYFSAFGAMLRGDAFHWDGRNRRPPRDPVNACLSYGYTLLVLRAEAAVRRAGLDPHLGTLHGSSRGALALDLAEPFRPLVDDFVLTLLNRGELSPEDFDRPPPARDGRPLPDDAVYLGRIGRQVFLRAWHRLRRRARRWPAGPNGTLDTALSEDAHRLRRFAEGELDAFVPIAGGGP